MKPSPTSVIHVAGISSLSRPDKFIWHAVILTSAILFLHDAGAATITWTGAVSTYWTNSANWSPAQVPTSLDIVVINSGNITFATNSQFYTLNFNGGIFTGRYWQRSRMSRRLRLALRFAG